MSSRHVRKWMIAAPIIGFSILGCGSSNTVFTGLGGSSGSGGTSSGGSGGAQQGGSGGESSAGAGGSAAGSSGSGGEASGGAGGSGGTSGGSGGSGGTTPEIDYEPFGIGDPWFFSSEDELDAFTISYELGATGTASWHENGEVHIPATFAASGDKVFIHFTAPWDSVQQANVPMDLSQRVLKARVRLASGTTVLGGVEPYSQSPDGTDEWHWGPGNWNSFADLGEFVDVEYDFAEKAATATEVRRFGLQVLANGPGDVEVIIDDIRLEPKNAPPETDGGVPPETDGGVPPETDGGVPIESDAGAPIESDAGAGDAGGGLGYEPLGVGDPWFFDEQSEMDQFEIAAGGGATLGSPLLVGGEVHIPVTFPNADGDNVQMHFTMPGNTADMTGRVIKANVRIAGGATANGGVEIFAQSGGWNTWSASTAKGIAELSSTTEVSLSLGGVADADNVQRFGIQLYAYSAGDAELIIDDIRLEPAP